MLFIFQGAAYYSSTYPFHQEYLSTSAFSRPFLEFYLVLFWRFSFIIVFVLEKKKEEKIWKKNENQKEKEKQEEEENEEEKKEEKKKKKRRS